MFKVAVRQAFMEPVDTAIRARTRKETALSAITTFERRAIIFDAG